MSAWLGFRAAASTVEHKFTTAINGIPSTLGGSPVVSVYQSGNATEVTTGVTFAADYDGRTGYNRLVIDTSSDGTFYAAGKEFSCVITTGTLNSQSVAGTEVCSFTIPSTSGAVQASVTVGTNNDKTGYGLSAAAISAIWQDTTAADFTAAGSIGKSIMNGVSLGTGLTVNAVTGLTASNLDAAISTRATPAQILTTALTESYAALNAVPTVAQALLEIRALLAENTVAGTTVTTKKLDGSTTAHTYTINSSSAPTSITTAS